MRNRKPPNAKQRYALSVIVPLLALVDIATLRTRLPNAIPSACLATADALAGLLDQCQQEYRGMAEVADGHASDVQTLMEAWPK